jgi:hypothetical protein
MTQDNNRGYKAKQKIDAEESTVVEKGVKEFSHSVGRPLSPDNCSGHKVTDKSYKNCHTKA